MRGNKITRYTPKDDPPHKLNLADIDERDEIDDGQQLSLVWCETHQKYEWHWLERNA